MKTIKAMDVSQFIDLLLTMKNGDTYNFATELNYYEDDRELDSHDVSYWFFARVICIPEYNSRFLLLDYAGGEEAMAIPLNGYKNGMDGDDLTIVPGYVQKYLRERGVDKVYVEMDE